MADENIDLVAALRQCADAVSTSSPSDQPRIMFQTGRVLWLAEEFEEAMPFLLDAAEAQEPAALAYLGDAYANGLGGAPEDLEAALSFYSQAASAGFKPADELANELAAEIVASEATSTLAATTSPQELNDCDRLAAHPADSSKLGAGVADENLNADRAIAACEATLARFPGVARLEYQLGRALYVGGRIEDGLPYLAEAAEKGHAAAKAYIADAYLEGVGGVEQDIGAAYTFYQEAAAGGFKPAAANALELQKTFASQQQASSTGSSKLALVCEVQAKHSSVQEVFGYMNFKFYIDIDFEAGSAKFSGETPAYGNNNMYVAGRPYNLSVADDGSSIDVQVDRFGPTGEGEFIRVRFDDGRAYMMQRFEMNRFLNFPVYNFMELDGYCGERAVVRPTPARRPAKRS